MFISGNLSFRGFDTWDTAPAAPYLVAAIAADLPSGSRRSLPIADMKEPNMGLRRTSVLLKTSRSIVSWTKSHGSKCTPRPSLLRSVHDSTLQPIPRLIIHRGPSHGCSHLSAIVMQRTIVQPFTSLAKLYHCIGFIASL